MTVVLLAQVMFVIAGFFIVGARRLSPMLLAGYAASQVVFVGAFAGVVPVAVAARIDELLIAVALVVWLRTRPSALATR